MTEKSQQPQSENSAPPQPGTTSAGQRFRDAVDSENPLQIAGTINAYCALMAKRAGFKAIYLSGAGVANACFGMPDLGMTSLTEVSEEIRRITAVSDLPLLVDADTGWGHSFSIARTVQSFTLAGAGAMHIEDQLAAKRCGHRPNKAIVSKSEMCDRISAAVDAKIDPAFVVMARTDAVANEGIDAAVERCQAYVDAGADMIFAEALPTAEDYLPFTENIKVPVLANITEFGKTDLLDAQSLSRVGIAMALYPLSAFRAMNQAAWNVYNTLRQEGTQKSQIENMQTRDELYDFLGYHHYEQKLDQLFSEESR